MVLIAIAAPILVICAVLVWLGVGMLRPQGFRAAVDAYRSSKLMAWTISICVYVPTIIFGAFGLYLLQHRYWWQSRAPGIVLLFIGVLCIPLLRWRLSKIRRAALSKGVNDISLLLAAICLFSALGTSSCSHGISRSNLEATMKSSSGSLSAEMRVVRSKKVFITMVTLKNVGRPQLQLRGVDSVLRDTNHQDCALRPKEPYFTNSVIWQELGPSVLLSRSESRTFTFEIDPSKCVNFDPKAISEAVWLVSTLEEPMARFRVPLNFAP